MKRSAKQIICTWENDFYNLTKGRKAILKKDYFFNGEGWYSGIWEDGTNFEAPSVFFDDVEVYDNKMILTRKEAKNDGNVYTYETEGKDFLVSFKMHPKKAFCFAIIDNPQELKKAILNDIFEAFVKQGIKQKEYKGGFDEAVSVLNF